MSTVQGPGAVLVTLRHRDAARAGIANVLAKGETHWNSYLGQREGIYSGMVDAARTWQLNERGPGEICGMTALNTACAQPLEGDLMIGAADTGTAEWRTKAAQLRALIVDGRLVRAVGAHDGLGAKLVDRAGFEAVWASGFELSASHGLPDASLLSMTQYLDAAEAMDAMVGIPVVADCDTGFGGPLNVAHLMHSYERRGIAAICIEDKAFPKVNSFAAAEHQLISTEDFAAKIRAAKMAQRNPDTILIARTESLIAGQSVDQALTRARSYAAAGADAILVHSKSRTAAQVLEFGARWDLGIPLVAVPTTYGDVHENELLDAGFRVVIYANHGLRAAVSSMITTLGELAKAGRGWAVEDQIASMSEVFELQDMHLPFSATS